MIKNNLIILQFRRKQSKTECNRVNDKVVSIKLHAKEGIAILSFLFIQPGKTSPRPSFSLRFARWLWFFSRRISSVHLASYRNEVYIRLKQTFCLPETEPLFR